MKIRYIFYSGILFLISLFLTSPPLSATTLQDETLHYTIRYKWGAIQKDAATATLSLRSSGNNYLLTLTAKTLPWADNIYQVRDTLKSVVVKDGFVPKSYTKISHEGGDYGRDQLIFTKLTNSIRADATRLRIKSKGERSESTKSMAAVGAGYDMLSVFYYLRFLNFDKLISGQVTKVNIFSGKKVETLTLRGHGKEIVTLPDKRKIEAYKIGFSFTTDGGKKSSDNITAWISADSRHIPVKVVGQLPVGAVHVYLTNF